MKKVVVNENCIGCGACQSFSEAFNFKDDGLMGTVEDKNIIDNMNDEEKENVTDALENCPTGAIEIVEVEEEEK